MSSVKCVISSRITFNYFKFLFSEFRRIDANSDQQITFAEFILADRRFIEDKSRLYHKQDLNGICFQNVSLS